MLLIGGYDVHFTTKFSLQKETKRTGQNLLSDGQEPHRKEQHTRIALLFFGWKTSVAELAQFAGHALL